MSRPAVSRPKNFCRACNQDFNSLKLFDLHRVGKHAYLWSPEQEDGRRCLDVEEMSQLGWTKNAMGRWYDPVAAADIRLRASAFAVEASEPPN